MSSTLAVDTHGLAAVGRRTQEIAAQLPGELARLREPSDEAVAGLDGWRTGPALARCTQAWEECLRRLAAEVDGNGLNLAQVAANYSAANQDVHAELARVAGSDR
jgi:hypothetical protein